jgi:hypothetical protein
LLNETKISFLLLPFLVLVIGIVSGRFNLKSLFYIFVFILSLIFLANQVYLNIYHRSYFDYFSSDYLEFYLFEPLEDQTDLPRFYRINFALNYLSELGNFYYLFGKGIGSVYVGGEGSLNFGVISDDLKYTLFNQGTRVQLFQMLMEFGVLGTFLIIITFLVFLFKLINIKFKRKSDYFAILFMVVVLITLVYQNMLFTKQLSFVFFFYIYSSLQATAHLKKIRIF